MLDIDLLAIDLVDANQDLLDTDVYSFLVNTLLIFKQFFAFKEVFAKRPEDIFKTSSRPGHQQIFPGKILPIPNSEDK